MCDTCGCVKTGETLKHNTLTVEVMESLMSENDRQAASNREHLESKNVLCLNIMGSPGSGKTTLLERTIDALKAELKMGVIEGDLETENDAERIRAKGVPAYQITTGSACHLDAVMVHRGLHNLPLNELDVVFIENVGNLVCPAVYDLGAHLNVILLSVTEGDDKPMKYPVMFRAGDVSVITKTDLLPYCNFDVDKAVDGINALTPRGEIFVTGEDNDSDFERWMFFLRENLKRTNSNS